MKKEDLFSITFILSIILTRVYLYFWPISNPIIAGLKVHHWMIGVLIILIYFIISYFKEEDVIIVIFAVGLALFVDELTFILTGGKNHADNYSVISLIGTMFFGFLILFFQKYILQILPLKEKEKRRK